MLRIDPAQRHRLEEIRDKLHARIAEAEREGRAGEAEGLRVSLAAATSKIAQADLAAARRAEAVHLGIPAYRGIPAYCDIAAATLTAEGPVTTDDLAAALRARASGLYPLEAGTGLLISNGAFLHRRDFTGRFIQTGTSISDGTTPMAVIDWDAAVTALNSGGLPCSGGERRILQLAASLAAGTPSASATTSPASTTAIPPCSSPRSGTRPASDQGATGYR